MRDNVVEQVGVCIHCHNPVEKINYGDKKQLTPGQIFNEYRHSRPRPYPTCGVSPLMSEDVEWVNEEDV